MTNRNEETNMYRQLLAASAVLTLAVGCASTPAPQGEPATKVQEIAEMPAAPIVISGKIAYRERMLLPSKSNRILIELTNAADGSNVYTLDKSGEFQAPIPFTLEIPASDVRDVETVTMTATLFSQETPYFVTPKPVVVYTEGKVVWPGENSDGFLMLSRYRVR